MDPSFKVGCHHSKFRCTSTAQPLAARAGGWRGLAVGGILVSAFIRRESRAEDGSLTTDVEGLVVATRGKVEPCLTAKGAFGGVSKFGSDGSYFFAFETCYQFNDETTYCWTKSYSQSGGCYNYCLPNGDGWQAIDAEYVNPVTTPNSCGTPCHDQHRA